MARTTTRSDSDMEQSLVCVEHFHPMEWHVVTHFNSYYDHFNSFPHSLHTPLSITWTHDPLGLLGEPWGIGRRKRTWKKGEKRRKEKVRGNNGLSGKGIGDANARGEMKDSERREIFCTRTAPHGQTKIFKQSKRINNKPNTRHPFKLGLRKCHTPPVHSSHSQSGQLWVKIK